MSGSVNKVTLIGRLGSDPQIRTQADGNNMATLSIATSEVWKDRETNEKRERTEWHRVVVFSPKVVDVIAKYGKKGQNVYIEGQLQTRKWTDPNTQQPRSVQEIILRQHSPNATFLFLDSRDPSGERQSSDDSYGPQEPSHDYKSLGTGSNQDSSSSLDEDEIPF